MDNRPYFTKRDIFYYIEICDKQQQRENLLASILDESISRLYIGGQDKPTFDLKRVKYYKDKIAASDAIVRINLYLKNKSDGLKICEMDAETFINIIPDEYPESEIDYIAARNLKLKGGMRHSMKLWVEQRKLYKAISAYKRVDKPTYWIPCKDCGLIPLIWEFDNGRSTACGCGKDEYEHHSIGAESIMSHITRHGGSASGYNSDELRMNWNQWAKTGQDIFKQQKQANPNIW